MDGLKFLERRRCGRRIDQYSELDINFRESNAVTEIFISRPYRSSEILEKGDNDNDSLN